MYGTPVIIWKMGRREAEVSCYALKGLIFDPDFFYDPTYYAATCQNEKITSHGVSFYN